MLRNLRKPGSLKRRLGPGQGGFFTYADVIEGGEDRFANGQGGVYRGKLRDVGNLDRIVFYAVNGYAAAAGFQHAEDLLNQRGFPGTVWAD